MFKFQKLNIDKSIQKLIGPNPKRLKAKGDWDGDNVINSKDCQPFNVFRQDIVLHTTTPMMDYPESYGYKGEVVWASPKKFMELARETSSSPSVRKEPISMYSMHVIHPGNLQKVKQAIASEKEFVPMGYIETRSGKPYGHEGRHRAVAMQELGYKKIPFKLVEVGKTPLEKVKKNLLGDNDKDGG